MSYAQEQRRPETWHRQRVLRREITHPEREQDDYLCLSCGSFSGEEDFCRVCCERSRQMYLSPEWDDLGECD